MGYETDRADGAGRWARTLSGWATALLLASVGAASAAPAPAAQQSAIARMFPWAVSEQEAPGVCIALLDPEQVRRASSGVLVYLDYGAGPQVVDGNSVGDLMRRLAVPRSGSPEVRTVARGARSMTLLARDVGPRDTGAVRCWFTAADGQWRLFSVEIVTARGAGR